MKKHVLAFIDIETTGLNPLTGDRLVEIGDGDDDVVDALAHEAPRTGPIPHGSAGKPSGASAAGASPHCCDPA